MNTFEPNTQATAPDARDFLGGNYLKKEDLNGPTTVTLSDVRSEAIPGASRRKLVVSFRELQKPLILNKTNTRRVAEVFGSTNTATWRGQITLYVDENVEYGGRMVGGIRIQPSHAHTIASEGNVVQMPAANGHPVAVVQRQDARQAFPAVNGGF